MASVLVMLRRREEDSGENYLNSSLGENSVLFQETLDVFVLGDLKEGDSFDGGHFVSFVFEYPEDSDTDVVLGCFSSGDISTRKLRVINSGEFSDNSTDYSIVGSWLFIYRH